MMLRMLPTLSWTTTWFVPSGPASPKFDSSLACLICGAISSAESVLSGMNTWTISVRPRFGS